MFMRLVHIRRYLLFLLYCGSPTVAVLEEPCDVHDVLVDGRPVVSKVPREREWLLVSHPWEQAMYRLLQVVLVWLV